MKDPLLLTEKDAAERMNLCARTLRKARQDGLLQYVLIGNRVRYTLADLESYIDRLRQVQPTCPSREPTRRTSQPSRKGSVIVPFSVRNADR